MNDIKEASKKVYLVTYDSKYNYKVFMYDNWQKAINKTKEFITKNNNVIKEEEKTDNKNIISYENQYGTERNSVIIEEKTIEDYNPRARYFACVSEESSKYGGIKTTLFKKKQYAIEVSKEKFMDTIYQNLSQLTEKQRREALQEARKNNYEEWTIFRMPTQPAMAARLALKCYYDNLNEKERMNNKRK